MMRPANNRHLDWEEITSLDSTLRRGTFKLNRHKNVNKGIKARGCLARELVDYLLSIRPANASGPIHVNPVTGKPYIDFRKQWKRLLEIAGDPRVQAQRQESQVPQLSAYRRIRRRATWA